MILRCLAEDPRNETALVTGRDRATLERWFPGLRVGFGAEHGICVKDWDGDWQILKYFDLDWKERLLPTLETFADRVPGAFVEQKEFSLVWHYRAVDPEQGRAAARELTDHLLAFTANIDVQVLRGSKVIEIRNAGVNKGAAARYWLSKRNFDFVLAIGDDTTDEEMFAALPATTYSFHVGPSRTRARFYLRDPREVIQLLEELAGIYADAAFKSGRGAEPV
jgi:trehalose 6-phosphate synthase/phosphatase